MKFLCTGLIATPLSLLVAFGVGAGTPAETAASQLAAACAQGAATLVVDGPSVRLDAPVTAGDALRAESLGSGVECLARAAGTPTDGAGSARLGRFANWTVTADEAGRPVFTSTTQG